MNDEHLQPKIGQYALIKNSQGQILVLERSRSKTWSLPGGRLNKGEDWDKAIIRELKEELNIDAINPIPVDVNILEDQWQTKYCVYFTVETQSDLSAIKISDEHSNYCWVDSTSLDNLKIEDDKVKKIISKNTILV